MVYILVQISSTVEVISDNCDTLSECPAVSYDFVCVNVSLEFG